MTNRKIRNGEQKIIDIINEKIVDVNLNYSDIRNSIKIELEKEEKITERENSNPSVKRLHFNTFNKALLAFSICICLCLCLAIVGVSYHSPFITDISLSKYIVGQDKDSLYSETYNPLMDKTGLYSLLMMKEINNELIAVHINMPLNKESKVYNAYLPLNVVNKVEKYFKNSVVEQEYLEYKKELSYYGINDMMAKYSFYCEKNKSINPGTELQWINQENSIKIPKAYNLIFTANIVSISKAYDINTSQVIDVKLKYITEEKNNNIFNQTLDIEYITLIDKDINKEQFINMNVINTESAIVEKVDGIKYIQGIEPAWCNYLEIKEIPEAMINIYYQLIKYLDILKSYLYSSKKIYDDKLKDFINVNYYNYAVVDLLKD